VRAEARSGGAGGSSIDEGPERPQKRRAPYGALIYKRPEKTA
jgi:hypothetical protein